MQSRDLPLERYLDWYTLAGTLDVVAISLQTSVISSSMDDPNHSEFVTPCMVFPDFLYLALGLSLLQSVSIIPSIGNVIDWTRTRSILVPIPLPPSKLFLNASVCQCLHHQVVLLR